MGQVIRPTLFLLITLIQTPATFCDYVTCGKSFSCANFEGISYPFWGGSRPAYCGHPDFELNCSNENLEITMGSIQYKVSDMNYLNQTAIIARNDLLSNICPSNPKNTTLDFNRFNYASSGNRKITLFYDCTNENPVSFVPILNLFYCSEENSNNSTGYGLWSPSITEQPASLPDYFNATCTTEIVVTLGEEAFEALVKVSNGSGELVRRAVGNGFSVQWKANNSLCEGCMRTGGRCGSNGISTKFVCYCANGGSSSLTCGSRDESVASSKKGLSTHVKLALVANLGLLGLVLTSAFVICYLRRNPFWKRGDERLKDIETFIRSNGYHALKLYTYSDIKKMTNSFNDKIGQGGFGRVYRGKLPDGRLIAVKLLTKTKGNGEEFINEVASISRTSHINIVTLLGFSYHRKRALVYEFMPNGSLDKFIGNKGLPNMSCQLEWKTLYHIAIGIARGLEYLHRGCNTRIMHFDIKPNNILLDKHFTPKISDFGLAKLCKKEESVQSLSMFGARGTIGYIAPEVFFRSFGGVSHKSDVYSYGMTVIDMVGLRENVDTGDQTSELYFPNWIYNHIDQGFDFNLEGITNEEDKEITMKMILVSLWCIQTNPADRPSIRRVVEMLEGNIASLQIPPKPFFCPPTVLPQQSSTSSITTQN